VSVPAAIENSSASSLEQSAELSMAQTESATTETVEPKPRKVKMSSPANMIKHNMRRKKKTPA